MRIDGAPERAYALHGVSNVDEENDWGCDDDGDDSRPDGLRMDAMG